MKKYRVLGISALTAFFPIALLCLGAPLLFYFFPHIMQHLFFLNFRKIPMTDYENMTSNGVKGAGRAFYLQGDEGRLGAWHILPASLSSLSEEEMESSLSDPTYPIVLYAHGNSFDRTISHRCELYNVLSTSDYHVIAFDYRGYGDSDGNPTEDGIVNDTRTAFEYVKKHAKGNTIVVWGHSMGTGVSTRLAHELSVDNNSPHGLVLESPFNNLRDVVMHHPFSIPIRWMTRGMVERLVLNPLRSAGLVMRSDQLIGSISCPILILHAEDDHVIPAKLAHRLKEAAVAANRDVQMVLFDASRRFAHKFIYQAEELPTLVDSFVTKCKAS